MAIVTLSGVHRIYPLGRTEVHALKGISFEIEAGDFISIAGPSGSGKSTILNMIGCVDVPSSGRVEIEQVDTATLSDRRITDLRRETVGFIFQNFNLVPVLSVYENVELPLLLGKKKPPPAERKRRTQSLIEAVGLADRASHKPGELSGGQRQRVAIARALVWHPKLVLADEPTANLDSQTAGAIIELMRRLNNEQGITFIFSTHDPTIVDMARHIIRLKDGEVEQNYRRGE